MDLAPIDPPDVGAGPGHYPGDVGPDSVGRQFRAGGKRWLVIGYRRPALNAIGLPTGPRGVWAVPIDAEGAVLGPQRFFLPGAEAR